MKNLKEQINEHVRERVYDHLWEQISNPARVMVYEQLWEHIYEQVLKKLRDYVLVYEKP